MATRGPAKMRRPSTLYTSGPQTATLSAGHLAKSSATCAMWQKRTALNGDAKATLHIPCMQLMLGKIFSVYYHIRTIG